MSLDEMTNEWRDQPEDGLKVSPEAIEQLLRATQRGRRFGLLVLFACGCALMLATAVIGQVLAKGGLMLALEAWPALLTQIAAVAVFVVMWRRRIRTGRIAARRTLPVRKSLEWSLEETRGRMAELRLLSWYAAIATLLTAVAASGLLRSGKMAPAHVVSFALLFGTILAAQILVQSHRYRTVLKPRRDRLAQILRQLEE